MIRKILLLTTLFLSFSGYALAQNSGFGAGLKFGQPTGLTAKYWLGGNNALSGSLGYSLLADGNFYLSVDYLYHSFGLVKSTEEFPVFYGFGARFIAKESDGGSFGIRGVGGISWHSKQYPLEVFVEFAPVFRLLPTAGLDLDAALGGRYYFSISQ